MNATITAPYAVDISQGAVNGSVSAQWARRPADQRFLTLDDLRNQVAAWATASTNVITDPREVVVNKDMTLTIPGADDPVTPTHWSFGQICSLVGAPANYLRRLPPALAAVNLRHGLIARSDDDKSVALYTGDGDLPALRAVTSPKYGRIYDYQVVDKVREFAATGDWKVPGMLDWSSVSGGKVLYDPEHPVTKDTTTLYASDRDVFMFLVDDRNPIEVGKLADGSPDYMFRGFMVSNSEVGGGTFKLQTMMLRGVCCNRNLWGVEDEQEIIIRHTSGAPEKFLTEAAPALAEYTHASAQPVIDRVNAAKAITFAAGDDGRDRQLDLLTGKLGFAKGTAERILATDPDGAGKRDHAPENLWELTNAVTAFARAIPHQNDRVAVEAKAGLLMA